jgi:hypothetical protein
MPTKVQDSGFFPSQVVVLVMHSFDMTTTTWRNTICSWLSLANHFGRDMQSIVGRRDPSWEDVFTYCDLVAEWLMHLFIVFARGSGDHQVTCLVTSRDQFWQSPDASRRRLVTSRGRECWSVRRVFDRVDRSERRDPACSNNTNKQIEENE